MRETNNDQFQVTHVLAGIARNDGGPAYSVPALASATASNNIHVVLRTCENKNLIAPEILGLEIRSYKLGNTRIERAIRASNALKEAIFSDASEGRILHVHGLWLMPNVYPAWARRRFKNARIIHAPRGMLGKAALDISAWKKRPFWSLWQRSALETADCLHATAVSEYDEIRAMGIRTPVAIIPNGIEIPELQAPGNSKRSVVLSLGRLHPKKGLDCLVRAWAEIETEFPNWDLRIVGPTELKYDQQLRQLAVALGASRISIEGPVYGKEKFAAYSNADLFVLPTLNENFGMTVAESLSAQVPVITTKGAPWAGLQDERCGWWIDQGVAPLVKALRESMQMDAPERLIMGIRGRRWMERDFRWESIAKSTVDVYRWLKFGGVPPNCVRMN
jgi:glycosyltransferase involved in cell wall biosynthesis